MHGANVQSTLIPDAMAIIASCTGSRSLMELAVALRAIATGKILLPPDRSETSARIAQDLMNRRWNLEAHVTLVDPRVQYFAKAFCIACIQAVPLTAENPTRDLVWQTRVRATLAQDALLQSHAKLLLQHIRLRVTPAQPAVVPAIAANANQSPKRDKAELHARAKQFAEEFVRRWEAQKAQAAVTNTLPSVSNPVQVPQAVPEAPSIAAPAPISRRVRVFRNVAARARYASVPPILGLGLDALAIRNQSIAPTSTAPPN